VCVCACVLCVCARARVCVYISIYPGVFHATEDSNAAWVCVS